MLSRQRSTRSGLGAEGAAAEACSSRGLWLARAQIRSVGDETRGAP